MGNKYVKLVCAILGIILLSYFQYQELKVYYYKNLPYVEVERYKKSQDMIEGPTDISIDELVASSHMEGTYSKDDLHALASYENETSRVDKISSSSVQLNLKAAASVLMDGDSERILYGENENQELAMASTTKIMTCIVALENGNLDDVVTVSKYASQMPDVQLNIAAGDQYYLKDLLYSLMLESHNDSAVAIAEHIGGSVEGFAKMMNEKAKELGCEHTNFVTPNGLDAEGHYTTAKELGIIACYAIKNEKFIEITNTLSHEIYELKKNKLKVVTNKNRFLYLMDGAIGVKTGFTNNAGYCFVGALKRDGKTYVSVVLGSGWPPNKGYKWSDTTLLMNYGIDYFDKMLLIDQRVELPAVYIEEGIDSKTNIYTEGNMTVLVRKDEKVRAEYEVPKIMKAPIKEGQQIGYLNFYINDELYKSLPIYTESSIEKMDFSFCFDHVMTGFCWMKH